jgi:hypothetical protein
VAVAGGLGDFGVLLTDPGGRRTGADPATGADLREIPASGSYTDALANDSTGARPTAAVTFVEVDRPQAGVYTLEVRGLAPGAFTVSVDSRGPDGYRQRETAAKAMVTAGVVVRYKLRVRSTKAEGPLIVPD